MKIFLTGGTGFIGKHLIRRLQKGGHEIFELSRARVEEGRGCIKKEMEVFQPEAIIHLAWEGIPDASETLAKKNMEMSMELIRIAGEVGCKTFVGIGSSLEYGGLEGRVSEKQEGTPPNPLYEAKAKLWREGKKEAESLGMKFLWARPFYVYGPEQREESLVSHLIITLQKGEKSDIKNPDGSNDFVYVKDVADALARLLEKNAPAGAYNIGSGYLTSVREIVEAVAQALDKPAPELPLSGTSSPSFYADISKIEQATGWRPSTRLEQGIQNMIIWEDV